jgi:hypothetical protein
MIFYKNVTIPEHTKEVEDKTLCDCCQAPTPWPDPDGRHRSSYDVNEVEIRHKHGTSFPEGSDLEVLDLDICPTCFVEKIVPMLGLLGIKINYKSRNY